MKASVEVVFSNKYGPDDDISPRGMGVRFLNISGGERKVIAEEVLKCLVSGKRIPKLTGPADHID